MIKYLSAYFACKVLMMTFCLCVGSVSGLYGQSKPDSCARVVNKNYTEYSIICPGEYVKVFAFDEQDQFYKVKGVVASISAEGIMIKTSDPQSVKKYEGDYAYAAWDRMHKIKLLQNPRYNALLIGLEVATLAATGFGGAYAFSEIATTGIHVHNWSLLIIPGSIIALNRLVHTLRVSTLRMGKFDGYEIRVQAGQSSD